MCSQSGQCSVARGWGRRDKAPSAWAELRASAGGGAAHRGARPPPRFLSAFSVFKPTQPPETGHSSLLMTRQHSGFTQSKHITLASAKGTPPERD